jgi:tRNA pseudouridine55 synthase
VSPDEPARAERPGERRRVSPDEPAGVVIVDKPAGWTSHDVVARVRRLAGTRRVGHAGTLDPMATGVLLVGVGRATRLLGYLAAGSKAYLATARLGASTDTDDATGQILSRRPAGELTAEQVSRALGGFTGRISQRPPAFSAVKVAGRRSYVRARAGEEVDLQPRQVTVHRLTLLGVRRVDGELEVDLDVECSAGTYIRAIARDLGAALGVGGHLSALRRTRVGAYTLDQASSLEPLRMLDLADVARSSFAWLQLAEPELAGLRHGQAVTLPEGAPDGPLAVLAGDGRLVALVDASRSPARPLVVFDPGGTL